MISLYEIKRLIGCETSTFFYLLLIRNRIYFSYNCSCVTGFTGLNCEQNIDDCLLNPCRQFEQCVDGINSFQCVCPHGFTGQLCNISIDYCSGQPCFNGATCNNFQGEFLSVNSHVQILQSETPTRYPCTYPQMLNW